MASPPMSASYQFSYSPLSANIKLEFSNVPSGSFSYLRDWGTTVTENPGAGTTSVTSKDMQKFVSGLVAGGVYSYYVDDDNKLQLVTIPFTDPSGNAIVVRYVMGVIVKNPVCIPITDIQ
ncbi:MAG: hypothetical protein K2Q09_07640 [Phycisphaerales bacterium]|nr:hypothetical protein [Phycisphaerales bacterium]